MEWYILSKIPKEVLFFFISKDNEWNDIYCQKCLKKYNFSLFQKIMNGMIYIVKNT